MNRLKAVILWPLVYILDILIGIIGKQTFKQSRKISKAHFNRIMNRQKSIK